MTLYEVLRAIVRGDGHLLNDAKWVAGALEAVDQHEQDAKPAVPADVPEPDVPPAPAPELTNGGGL